MASAGANTLVQQTGLQTPASSSTPVPEQDKRPTVCVFCGASPGKSPAHLSAARDLARALHANGMDLVYGGGTVGIMGEVAKELVSVSGPQSVHGIIPAALMKFERNYQEPENTSNGTEAANGTAHSSSVDPQRIIDERLYGRTTVVKDMHTRKQMMASEVISGGHGGGFVAMSGGYGTLEELMEVVTWNQLGIHERPVVVFNVDGYWDGLLQWVNKAVESGFIAQNNAGIMVEAKTADEVVHCLKNYEKAEGRFKLHWGER